MHCRPTACLQYTKEILTMLAHLLGSCLASAFLGVHGVAVTAGHIPAKAATSAVVSAGASLTLKRSTGDGDPKPAANGTVKVELYYESRCPACEMFLNQSLAVLWQKKDLRSRLNITLYPYGNAQTVPVTQISEGYKFWHKDTTGEGFKNIFMCQHGSDECFGNLVHACASDVAEQAGDKGKGLELAFCMAGLPEYSIEKSSYECMEKVGIDHDKVSECVKGARGNELMTKMAAKTALLKNRKGTPWIMINDRWLPEAQKLMQIVCMLIGSGKETPSCAAMYPHKEAQHPAAHSSGHPSGAAPGGHAVEEPDFQVLVDELFKETPGGTDKLCLADAKQPAA